MTPETPLLGIHAREMKHMPPKKLVHELFIALFITVPTRTRPKRLAPEENMKWVAPTQWNTSSAKRRNEVLMQSTTQMNPENILSGHKEAHTV